MPFEALKIEERKESQELFEKFNMFREITMEKVEDLAKFAYLEHLFRISTDINVCRNAVEKMSQRLKDKLIPLVNTRNEDLQTCLHRLEEIIKPDEISAISAGIISVNYKWDGFRLISEETQLGQGETLPLCYTLSYIEKRYLLYTANMTYIDGYDPYSSNTCAPLISVEMIKNLSKGFYQKGVVKVKKAEVKKVEVKKDSIRRPSFNFGAVAEEVKKSIGDIPPVVNLIEQKEEISEIPTEDQFEEEKTDKSSEKESIPDDDSSSTYEFPQPAKPQGEKVWEKFQKRATEKQKERDQCGPGDCLIS